MNNTYLENLCDLIALKIGRHASRKSVQKYLDGIYKVALEQLKFHHKFYIPKFGTFVLIEKEERTMKVGDPINGGTKYIYVKPRYDIEFRPADALERNINENEFVMKNKKRKTQKPNDENISMADTLVRMLNQAEKNINKE